MLRHFLLINEVVGYEALLRWVHPENGFISPGEFIPVAEKSGMYYDLDLYVLKKCLEILCQNPEIVKPVSINLSANSMSHADLVPSIMEVMKDCSIDRSRIELEITESAFINADKVLDNIKALKQAGFKICLDDFGSGYSSLSYLLKFPLDVVKIDRAFVLDVEKNTDTMVVLGSMLSMIKNLNKEVVVEGVETEGQLNMLRKLGADIIQGYYYFKPLAVEDVINLAS